MVIIIKKNKSGDEIRWVESGFFIWVVIMLVGDEERTLLQSSMVVMADELLQMAGELFIGNEIV